MHAAAAGHVPGQLGVSAPFGRTYWRVLWGEREEWCHRAHEALLLARSLVNDGEAPEVDRVVLRRRVKRIDLLNRRNIVESSMPARQGKAPARRKRVG